MSLSLQAEPVLVNKETPKVNVENRRLFAQVEIDVPPDPHAAAANMKVVFGQINTTVGDMAGNEAKMVACYKRAVQDVADIVIFPELATCGYPPRDLLLKRRFLDENLASLDRLAAVTGETGMLVGFVGRNKSGVGREATNSVALLHRGKIQAVRHKTLLPTYDVFDEDRYFEPATENTPVEFKGTRIGLTVCEDVWNDEDFWRDSRRYRLNPARGLIEARAKIIFNVSASPWHLGKNQIRRNMLASLAAKLRAPLLYCNLVGGNDELVFDGSSLGFNAEGKVIVEGADFAEDYICVDPFHSPEREPRTVVDEERIYKALVLGLRDYLHKCGFRSAVLGLSGGIDSAVTAVLARDALGPENVRAVSMPSEFSSQGSLDDAQLLAKRLGIGYDVISTQPIFDSGRQQLRAMFKGLPEDATEENMQARIRGMLLMALSNKFNSLVLTTGNKSELAVGYCTIYGDMCGGLAVISDVPKTMIYRLAQWINRSEEIIPINSITKAPSAELRPNQTDQDSLPPYDILDAILEMYVVQMKSTAEIIAAGFDPAVVRKIIRLIDINEYKRRQAAPGLKITSKAFGMGRRIPIAQRFQS